jgi:hypothetical protein
MIITSESPPNPRLHRTTSADDRHDFAVEAREAYATHRGARSLLPPASWCILPIERNPISSGGRK